MDHPRIQKKLPPLWMLVILFALVYTALAAGLTSVLHLPWQAPVPLPVGLGVGVVLWGAGGVLLVGAFRSLGLRRAFGRELFLPKTESRLITDGLYAYTRNPLYLSVILLLLGWSFVLRLTPLAFLTILFGLHFWFVAKWEEKELGERFGREYEDYKKRVPLLIPRRKRGQGDYGEERH